MTPRARVVTLGLALALAACARSGVAEPASGSIRGTVLRGPLCPVVTSASPCPDEPVGAAKVVVRADGEVVATAMSGPDGAFSLRLPPGSYRVELAPGGAQGTPTRPVSVALEADEVVRVELRVDTGIR